MNTESNAPKKILVTGLGFIGSYLVENLLQKHSIIGMGRNAKSNIKNTSNNQLNILSHDLVKPLPDIGPIDVVVHTAASHPNSKPIKSDQEFKNSNVDATLQVAEYAKKVGAKAFIYLSSISIYGTIGDQILNEFTQINNPTPYGATKLEGEEVLKNFQNAFPIVCIRLPGIVGPKSQNIWIQRMLTHALKGEEIVIYNPESLFNNIVHLSDIERFVSHVIDAEILGFEVVNMGASVPMKLRQVIDLLLKETGSHSKVTVDASPNPSFHIDIGKLQRVYQFSPITTKESVVRHVKENLP